MTIFYYYEISNEVLINDYRPLFLMSFRLIINMNLKKNM